MIRKITSDMILRMLVIIIVSCIYPYRISIVSNIGNNIAFVGNTVNEMPIFINIAFTLEIFATKRQYCRNIYFTLEIFSMKWREFFLQILIQYMQNVNTRVLCQNFTPLLQYWPIEIIT